MVRLPKLDLEASVPGIEEAAPYSVNAPAPTINGFQDYIPGDGKLLPRDRPKPEPASRVRHVRGADYISGEKMLERKKNRNKRIRALAKSIYNKNKSKNEEWESCRRIVENATEKQLRTPTPALERALLVYRNGKPMTKDRAIDEARRHVETQSDAR